MNTNKESVSKFKNSIVVNDELTDQDVGIASDEEVDRLAKKILSKHCKAFMELAL